jgi:acyl carrier protein
VEKLEIIEEIRNVLISVLQHENFQMKDEISAADVDGWDSLTHMMIITEIEKRFDIKFKLKELNKLNNLGNLIEMVSSKTGQK